MASKKFYGYYIKGNKLALIEKDVSTSGSDLNAEDYGKYKSPKTAVADGLEIEYTYAPTYLIESTDVNTTTAESWDQDNDGNFRLRAASGTDWTSSPNLSNVTHIILENAGRFNGLHKVSTVQSTRIVTTTKISASTSATLFEETPTLYYDVSVLQDESFELDLTRYQANAVVYYLQAKKFEDAGDIEGHEYYMKKFKTQLEKASGSRQYGPHFIQSHWSMR